MDGLKAQIEGLQNQNETLLSENTKMKTELSQKTEMISKLIFDFEESKKSLQTVDALQTVIKTQNTELAELRVKFEQVNSEKDEIKGALTSRDHEMNAQSERITLLENENRALQSKVTEVEESFLLRDEKILMLESSENAFSTLHTSQLQLLEIEISTLRATNNSLEQQLLSDSAEMSTLREECRQSHERIVALETEIQDHKTTIMAPSDTSLGDHQVDTQPPQNNEFKQSDDNRDATIAHLEDELRSRDELIRQLMGQLSSQPPIPPTTSSVPPEPTDATPPSHSIEVVRESAKDNPPLEAQTNEFMEGKKVLSTFEEIDGPFIEELAVSVKAIPQTIEVIEVPPRNHVLMNDSAEEITLLRQQLAASEARSQELLQNISDMIRYFRKEVDGYHKEAMEIQNEVYQSLVARQGEVDDEASITKLRQLTLEQQTNRSWINRLTRGRLGK